MQELLKGIFNRHTSIANLQSSRPAAAIVFAFSCGIASSLFCRNYLFGAFVVATLSLAFASLLALCRDRLALALILGLAAISVTGLLTALAHRDGFPDSDLRQLLRRHIFPINEPVSFEGCVVEESRSQGDESVATVELHAFQRKEEWVPCTGKGILRIAGPDPGNSSHPPVPLMRGDRIRGWATWHLPHNYENPGSADRVARLTRRGIFALGRVKSRRLLERIPGECSTPWSGLSGAISARVQSSIEPARKLEKGQPAAVLASLTIGDYTGLDNNTREAFQNSGTYHVLVVSGLHVAWIAGLLLQFFKLIRLPERIRYLLIASVILLYTCVVGFQASITRCLWMFLLYLIGRIFFRRADPVNILLTSALILLAAQPDWLFETGFQLSFLSVMAITMTAVPAINKYLRPAFEPMLNSGNPERLFLQSGPWHRCGRYLRTRCEILIEGMTDTWPRPTSKILLMTCRGFAWLGLAMGSMIIASVSVQIWLEPLLALNFNRMSWISPLANLIIVPLSSIVLAAGIAASLASFLPQIGQEILRVAAWLASLLLHSTDWITTLRGAWQRCPTPLPPLVLGCTLLLFIWSFFQWRRFWIPCFCVIAFLACLSFGSAPIFGALVGERSSSGRHGEAAIWQGNPLLSFTFLDVGEGDSIVVRFPDQKVWVLDAGGLQMSPSHEDNSYAFDVGEAVVSRYLWHEWITRFDRLILSHTDLDHAGGIPSLIKNFRITGFAYPQAGSGIFLRDILKSAAERHIHTDQLCAGAEERVGPVTVSVLNPPADSTLGSANENSLVLKFSFRNFSALLTGDLEKSGEMELFSLQDNLRSRLLKVAHHGSRMGTSDAFLDRIRPGWAVISVGRNNPFGHPSREVLLRLQKHRVGTFLTPGEGAITVESDGTRYLIRGHVRGVLERGELPEDSSDSASFKDP